MLEITENMIEDAPRAEETLGALEALGVRLAIDGFGTGFTSLSNLANLPVHALKVDRSFVGLLDGRRDKTLPIVSATLGIARALGIATVADGVETREQASMLREIGCDAGQGPYFSAPLPFGAACEFLGARGPCGHSTTGRRHAGPIPIAAPRREFAAGWTAGERREHAGEKRRDAGRPR